MRCYYREFGVPLLAAGEEELTNMIWASMHDLMIGLLYYDVEVFIFLASVFFLTLLFVRQSIHLVEVGDRCGAGNAFLLHGLRFVLDLRF